MSMDQPEQIGERLRRLREALGFDQAKRFAEFVGISEQAWNHFERGRRPPTVPDAIKVAGKTGASLDWIYRGMEHTLPMHVLQKLTALDDTEEASRKRAANGQ